MFSTRTAKKKTTQSATEEMSRCPKCGEQVYYAERRTILGKDWHARCLRCDKCDKALTPGQHSAHQNKPYCNACYQVLFGPEGFRQGAPSGVVEYRNRTGTAEMRKSMAASVEPRKSVGTVEMRRATAGAADGQRKESRKSSGKAPPGRRDTFSKSDIKTKIKEYNLYKTNPVEKLKSREANGMVQFEGILKLYWGLKRPIILSPGAMYSRRQSSIRGSIMDFVSVDDDSYRMMIEEAEREKKMRELGQERSGKKLHEIASSGWESQDRMPNKSTSSQEDSGEEDYLTHSLPAGGFNSLPSTPTRNYKRAGADDADGNSLGTPTRSLTRGNSMEPGYNSRSPIRKRSASFRKISKQKRMEGKAHSEMNHKFIPPHGSSTSVRVTSSIPTKDVILMLIAKYKVENPVEEFSLCVVDDKGETLEYFNDDDYPLQKRLRLGPSEDIAKIFLVEAKSAEEEEQLTEEVATWIKFTLTELQQFNIKYEEELGREENKIRKRFSLWKEALQQQLQNGRTGRFETDV